MKESTNERAQELAARLDGNIRRLKLPGQEMAIVGMTYEGEKFDLTSLQGKVVLVDFWATWCGPCRAEIPNMKALYKKYHERGLEIVGISTDDDRGALDEFLKEEQLPWIILHEEEGKSEAAVHYGISALPTMILIGRDAKVLSIHARGPALAEKLAELFPEEGAKDSQ
jgi:thiol-disulfide isomerase/thioredoxin